MRTFLYYSNYERPRASYYWAVYQACLSWDSARSTRTVVARCASSAAVQVAASVVVVLEIVDLIRAHEFATSCQNVSRLCTCSSEYSVYCSGCSV